ncbi:Iduronate 2-sulfatase [Habropoda laboriosa]|uniref:Iduronate 2-sulfatase n=1 Tax=Habropoda laboriosa TaxID=597456 RepID=A0A0L7R8Z1_9HYME|nr:PREDICTED: iduronate 2-sulfatase [Habropoda laboriosa]KOC67246.1 Iduronate 2-sulfatase [Habropoda laboriosa]
MFLLLCFTNFFVWCIAEKQNFVLIIVDDLRTALGCYGDVNAYTPNIDRLAGGAAIFSEAFAQQALCAPSRNSFLTSRRPDTLHLYDFYSYWRKDVANFTTLPQHLKNNGYITKSVGKVFHPGTSSNHSDDSPYSWSETPFHPFTERYKNAPVCQTNIRISPAQNLVCPVKVLSMPNKTLPDIEILREAKYFLSNQAGNTNPFFLAVGFQKPHIPFKYPEKYLKFHPLYKFKVPKPYKWLKNVSSIAYNPWNDLRRREDVASLNLEFPWEKIPKNFARLIIQSYYASVTYIDDLIGKLINQLEMSSIWLNTTVILMSDHGWSLGEHTLWAKYNNYDVTLRVPLIISIPGLTFERPTENTKNSRKNDRLNLSNNHIIIDSIVELVDIFPTMADLANITIPVCSNKNAHIETTCSEGITLLPLIRAALKKESLLWKNAAFGQYPRPSIEPSMHPNSDEPRLNEIKAMGYTLRTNRYRYTAWLPFNSETKIADWNHIIAEELYDYNTDKGENRNVAFLEKYTKLKKKLKILLQCGSRNVLSHKFNL